MRMNKKKMTVGLTCVLATGLLIGSVEYASHTFAATNLAVKGAEIVAEAAVENVKQTKAVKGVTKDESVYVTLDANGQKQDVIVSDWLKNSGVNGILPDTSNLTDIQNTKGDEQFTQNGDSISWETEDKDIYYQGKSDEELPVSMEITYYLDGQEIAPEELAGKSGKLEMKIQYKNHSKQEVKTGGKTRTVYTPFVMATGMILPVEKFKNVTIDHGELLSEGDNDVVMAYGMPGLRESLDLDNLDFGDDISIDLDKITEKITDSVTITADVTDFELGQTYTVATAKIFEDIDFGDLDGGEDLEDKLDELSDAAEDLVDGSDKIQSNLKKLDNKFDTYAKAMGKLKSSVKTIDDGSEKINAAAKKYTKSTDKLLKGVDTYTKGTKDFAKSTKKYSQSTKKLVDGIGTLDTESAAFPESYEEFHTKLDAYTSGVNALLSEENMNNLTGAAGSLKSGVKTVDDGLKQVQAGVSQINAGAGALNQQDTTALLQGLESLAASGDAQTKQIAENAIAYIQNAKALAATVDAATNGKADGEQDANGTKDLAVALSQLVAATDTESEEENLYTGLASLEESAKMISSTAKELRGYKTSLMEGSGLVQESIGKITSNLDLIYKNGKLIVANNEKLESAADSLVKNAGKIQKNSKKLTASSGSFRQATNKMAKGTGKLWEGVKKLVSSTGQVSDGIGKLTEGAMELYNGMEEFQEEGTNKLSDAVESILDGGDDLQNRAKAVNKAAKRYTTFSGTTKGMDGDVKFIMTTQSIKAEE